jgi:bleomycin hydrolase
MFRTAAAARPGATGGTMKRSMTSVPLLLILIMLAAGMAARADDIGKIDPAMLQQLKRSVTMDAGTRALVNAISNNKVSDLALNREIVAAHNAVFNVNIAVHGITNQRSTGRCWMFAGLNVLRPAVIKKYKLAGFEFSETYLFFWDKLEKANLFLEMIIASRDKGWDDRELQAWMASPVGDGGWWSYYVNLIEKYGLVPKSVMPDNSNTDSSRAMNAILETVLRDAAAAIRSQASQGAGAEEMRSTKLAALKNVYRLLVLHLGPPCEKFTWSYENKDKKVVKKSYTPLEFYHEATAGTDLKAYVTLADHPVHPYDRRYQLRYCRNFSDAADMDYLNLGIAKLKAYALKALESNEAVWFGADSSQQMDRKLGIMAEGIFDTASLYGYAKKMSKAEQLQYRDLSPVHAMALVGADREDGRPLTWRVENSWGGEVGDKGYWTMYDDWFDRYVLVIIVDRKILSEADRMLLDTEPVVLPSWDPLAALMR